MPLRPANPRAPGRPVRVQRRLTLDGVSSDRGALLGIVCPLAGPDLVVIRRRELLSAVWGCPAGCSSGPMEVSVPTRSRRASAAGAVQAFRSAGARAGLRRGNRPQACWSQEPGAAFLPARREPPEPAESQDGHGRK